HSFAFSPDTKVLNTAYWRQELVIEQWEARSGKRLRSLTLADKTISEVDFSPNGELLALWKNEKGVTTLIVTDATSRKEVHRMTDVGFATFSPQSDLLAVASVTGAQFVDARTGKWRGRLEGGVHDFVFSPDGKRVASNISALSIGLWDVATGRNLHPRS